MIYPPRSRIHFSWSEEGPENGPKAMAHLKTPLGSIRRKNRPPWKRLPAVPFRTHPATLTFYVPRGLVEEILFTRTTIGARPARRLPR